MFNTSITDIESDADKCIQRIITDKDYFWKNFVTQGYLSTDFLDDFSVNVKSSKNQLVKNLQKRGYLTMDKADRYKQIGDQRPYSYKIGERLMKEMSVVTVKVTVED